MTTTTLLVTLNCPMALECGGMRSDPISWTGLERNVKCRVPPSAICASRGNAMTTSAKGRSGDFPGYRMPVPQRARDSRDLGPNEFQKPAWPEPGIRLTAG